VSWILVVEDNPADVYLIREAVRHYGINHELRFLDNGEKANGVIDSIDQDGSQPCPDLVLLDLNLPRITGIEVLQHIRRSSRCHRTPVIILTSSDAPADRDAAERFGAGEYFRKPVELEPFLELGAVVKQHLTRPAADGRASGTP
jgi:CheY-like chemotaxis protein